MTTKVISFITFFTLITNMLVAQFAPQVPLPGNDAIHRNDSRIHSWATMATVERGWMNILDTTLGKVSNGTIENVFGKADNMVISLGDGGSIIVEFDGVLYNGAGPDFAIFENGIKHMSNDSLAFLEFAFVEVSEDGKNFYRFPSISNIPIDTQNINPTTLYANDVHNLAGKYVNTYGTPFDLEDLKIYNDLDINNIKYIKLIDVIGSIDPNLAQLDSKGNIINDPFPTPFPTGGFDLDAVGLINVNQSTNINQNTLNNINIYPNPFNNIMTIDGLSNSVDKYQINIIDINGISHAVKIIDDKVLDMQNLPIGVYYLTINNLTKLIIKE